MHLTNWAYRVSTGCVATDLQQCVSLSCVLKHIKVSAELAEVKLQQHFVRQHLAHQPIRPFKRARKLLSLQGMSLLQLHLTLDCDAVQKQ